MDGYYHTDNGIVNYAIGRANNGLFYDEGGNSTSYYNAKNTCVSRNLRLPLINEVGIDKIPSMLGWTWTNSLKSGYTDIMYVFDGPNTNYSNISYDVYPSFRCVK